MARTFVGRTVATGMLLVAIALLAPAGAGASTVSVNAPTLTVTGGLDEVNQVTVERVGAFFRVSDDTALLTTSDPDCTGSGGHFSRCAAAGVTSIVVSGKSLDDRLAVSAPIPASLNGGAGGDILVGGPVADTLIAGPGSPTGSPSDSLFGGGGGDTLHGSTDDVASSNLQGEDGGDTLIGGPGVDNMFGGAGPDSFAGGDGNDTVNYGGSGVPVTVTVNNVANDGAAGENDNVRTDVESVFGSPNADDITGSPAPDFLEGGGATDILRGGAGPDTLAGGAGDDTMNGGAGGDNMSGGFDSVGADAPRRWRRWPSSPTSSPCPGPRWRSIRGVNVDASCARCPSAATSRRSAVTRARPGGPLRHQPDVPGAVGVDTLADLRRSATSCPAPRSWRRSNGVWAPRR